MGLLIGLLIGVAAVAGVSVGAVAFARKGTNAEIRKRLAASGVTADQNRVLSDAQRDLNQARKLLYEVRDNSLRESSKQAIDKADKLVADMRQQPEEIRRSNQFFSYYVPTLSVVLSKYVSLERSGTLENGSDVLEKAKGHMDDMSHAFDLMHDNLFKDEALDLSVEVEAMKMALKREGLS